MNKKIFREKSIERLTSPESLNDYIRVSNPGVWLLLSAIIVLLAGIFVWSYFGNISSWDSVKVIVDHGTAYCYAKEDVANTIEEGMPLDVNGIQGTIIGSNGYIKEFGVYEFKTDIILPEGTYEGTVLTENIQPKSLLFD